MKVPQKVREAVITRDGNRCLRCRQSILNVPASVHHRKPRGMGGTSDLRCNDIRNLVLLCGTGTTGCHGWVESNRASAREDGWLIASFDDLDRNLVRPDGSCVRLFETGGSVSWHHDEIGEAQ